MEMEKVTVNQAGEKGKEQVQENLENLTENYMQGAGEAEYQMDIH